MMFRLAGAMACCMAVTGLAQAQDTYPTKPIRLVVPFAVGGGLDITARIITPKMTELLGQQILVDNRPGAGAVIGTDLVSKAAPDGYTILIGEVSSFGVNPWLYKNIPYDSVKDFAPIGQAIASSFILTVHVSVPATDLKSLVATVNGNPGKYTYGSPGIGSMPHLCTEEFKTKTGGLDIVHVPYRGAGPMMNDLVAGQITLAIDAVPTSIPQIQAGAVRLIGNASLTRARALPDVPTLDEQGIKGFDCYVWLGLFAPAKTPPRIVTRLNEALNAALNDKITAARLADLNVEMTPHNTPETFAAYVKAELEKWTPIVKASGAQLE